MRLQGRLLAHRYRLVARLKRGGMGSVWLAEHVELGTSVAVKLMDRRIVDDEQALARFKREAQAAAALRSPHVVQILDYGVDEGTPYIAMELLDGDSLAYRLGQEGKLSPLETAIVITHVARAVGKAHAIGIVHRDLKPDNIFIVHNEDEELVKVLDFGIAKKTDHEAAVVSAPNTATGKMLGTPFYMSPEQAGGKKTVDHRTDIWAMGVIACECLTGNRPFSSDALGGLVLAICMDPLPVPSALGPVPKGFDEWFAKAADRNVDARYQSAKECAADLRRICGLEDRATLQSGSSSADEPVPSSRSRRLVLGVEDTPYAKDMPALGITAQQAGPISVTVRGPDESGRGRTRKLAAGVAAAVALAGGVVAYSLSSGTGDTGAVTAPLHAGAPVAPAVPASTQPAPDARPLASSPSSDPEVGAESASATAEASKSAAASSRRIPKTRPSAAPSPSPKPARENRPASTRRPPPVPVGDDLDLAF